MNDTDPIQMTDAEFTHLLDRYGADRAKWPAARVRGVERALAESADAARALEAARELDAWLGGLQRHEAPAGLAASIMARVERLGRVERPDLLERFIDWLTARLWRPVLVGALPVIAGLAIGFTTPEPTDTDLVGQIGTLAFVDLYAELNDAE